MNFADESSTRIGFWAVLLVGVFAWIPTTYPGYWQALEGFVPVFNAAQSSPLARIATEPDLWRGTGNATFLLTQPLIRLGVMPVVAVRMVFALSFILGGLGIYVWLRQRWGDKAAGLAGIVYMFLPPILATAYIRGSLSDALVMALFPMALAGTATFTDNRQPSSAGFLVLSMLWMWRTQAGLAVFATSLLVLYVILVERDGLSTLVVIVSGMAGAASLIPLWDQVAAAPVNFSDHYVYFFQLLIGGWNVAPSTAGWQDAYPFQLGFAALGFCVVALWCWWTTPQQANRPIQTRSLVFCTVGASGLIVLTLTISEPIWSLTHADRLLTYPWQLFLLASPLLALLAGSLPALLPSLRAPAYWIVLVLMVVLSSYPYLTTAFTQAAPRRMPLAIVGPNHNFVLLDAELVEGDGAQTALTISWQTLRPLDFDYNIFFQALDIGDDTDDDTGDDTAHVLGQLDVQPRNGERPITTWQPGEILTDTYRLDLSATPNMTDIEYHFGYYDWRDGQRLPVLVSIADGPPTIADTKLVFYGR